MNSEISRSYALNGTAKERHNRLKSSVHSFCAGPIKARLKEIFEACRRSCVPCNTGRAYFAKSLYGVIVSCFHIERNRRVFMQEELFSVNAVARKGW